MTNTTTIGEITNPVQTKETIKDKLTSKLISFCEFYAISNNFKDAALRAGYPDTYNLRKKLMNRLLVLAYISILRQEMIDDYIMQSEYCVMQYKKCIEGLINSKAYEEAGNVILKLSKLKLPTNNPLTGLILIKIG